MKFFRLTLSIYVLIFCACSKNMSDDIFPCGEGPKLITDIKVTFSNLSAKISPSSISSDENDIVFTSFQDTFFYHLNLITKKMYKYQGAPQEAQDWTVFNRRIYYFKYIGSVLHLKSTDLSTQNEDTVISQDNKPFFFVLDCKTSAVTYIL
jgi:hypothetical protein